MNYFDTHSNIANACSFYGIEINAPKDSWLDFFTNPPVDADADVWNEVNSNIGELSNHPDICLVVVPNTEHTNKVFLALIPGMLFIPRKEYIGHPVAFRSFSDEDFAKVDLIEFCKDDGFGFEPKYKDDEKHGVPAMHLCAPASIYGVEKFQAELED